METLTIRALSDSERHDLKTALLSIRWCADLLQPADGSAAPIALIVNHLQKSYETLAPVIEAVLTAEEGSQT